MAILCDTQKRILDYSLDEMFRLEGAFSPVLIIGGHGVGKRMITRAMAEALNVEFVEIPLTGSDDVLRERLFGSEAECFRLKDSQEPPGELARLDNCIVYFSELQNLPEKLHHDFQRLITRRRYSDHYGYEWQLPQGLMIVVGLTEGVHGSVTPDHWLCRQFDKQIRADVPHEEVEVLKIVQELIYDIQPKCHGTISAKEAVLLMGAAQWNIRTLREWIRRRIIKGVTSTSICSAELWEVIEEDVAYWLSHIEYCASGIPLEQYRRWAAQFPADLANIPLHILRKIQEAYYISAHEFQRGLQILIKSSRIEAKERVVFCKWQDLGKSGPMVTNHLKNRGNWKLIDDLDLDGNPQTWPRLNNGVGINFVLADDFVGSGRTLRKLFVKKSGKIERLVEYYPAGSIKILLLAAYEDPIREIREAARAISSQIFIHVFKIFGSKDRCFTPDSFIFALDEERTRVMEFCREVARRRFPPFLQANPFGVGDVASLCVFHHTVPNNSLPILWFDENPEQWHPLFPARGVYAVNEA